MSNCFQRYCGVLGASLLSVACLWANPAGAADLVRFKGGETITDSDLSQYLERRVDLRATARNKWAMEKILHEMAVSRTLVMEGVRLGEPRLPGKETERFDDAYALAIFKKLSPSCTPPADSAAARKFYDENPQAFQVPPSARVSRVILPVSERVAGEDPNAWLMSQAQAIASGAKSFDDVVKQADGVYRLDPQGDLGWVVLVDENKILRTLAAAKQGDMVGPVREGEFVYLFSIVEKREGRRLAWEEVSVSAPARVASYCRQASAKKLESDLLAKYGVVMESAAINSLFEQQPSK